MTSLKGPMGKLTVLLLLVSAISCAAAAARNTPECRALLLSEAERVEAQFKETAEDSNRKIESVFVPANFDGSKDRALMMRGAYIAFFKKKFLEPIAKIQAVPAAYRMAADSEDYPKACDNSKKFKKANDRIIATHGEIWTIALDDAEVFIDK